jgi:DNA-binding CsgD family transcriptional regulator
MWVVRSYEQWLEFIRELLNSPSPEFPHTEVQMQLASTLGTIVAWDWENADGDFGVEFSHPIDGWPTAADVERWRNEVRDLHPLLRWYRGTEDPRPMSLDRVPSRYIAPGAMEQTRELIAPVGVDQQLSIPCFVGGGHSAFIAAKSGPDFSDEDLQLARLIQPLLALLWLQGSALERCPQVEETYGLTGRELAVLQLLADGFTAEAMARRLGISPRTVHCHLAHVYRKLGVSDRMRAVFAGEAAGLVRVGRRAV